MQNDSYTKLLKKQKQFGDMQEVLNQFKEIIDASLKNPNLKAEHTFKNDIYHIKYFNRTIAIRFINNFDSGVIEFLLRKGDVNNIDYIYESIVTVISDKHGNVKSEQVGFENQLYKSVHFDILNYIIEQSYSNVKKKHNSGRFNRG